MRSGNLHDQSETNPFKNFSGAGAERAKLCDSRFCPYAQDSRSIDAASSQDGIAGLRSPCASLPCILC
jgi:hypothetical protein